MLTIRITPENLDSPLIMATTYEASAPRYLRQTEQIILYPQTPDQTPDFRQAEPKQIWCYTYEKAELARQQGNWNTAIAPGDNALSQSLFPSQSSERLQFVEVYARPGKPNQDQKFSEMVFSDEFHCPALYDTWNQIQDTALPNAEKKVLIEAAQRDFNCIP